MGNCDTRRINKANKAIQACLLGKLHLETLNEIQKTGNNQPENEIIKFAKKNCEMMTNHFFSSQESICKATCERYANNQHMLISRAVKNKEDLKSVMSISKYIVDDSLLKVYGDFHEMVTSSKCYLYHIFCH